MLCLVSVHRALPALITSCSLLLLYTLCCAGSVQPSLVTLPLPPLGESSSQQGSVSCLPFFHLPEVEAGADPLRSPEEKV
ncbi:unnamed protein product, partial [Ectocarpus sp. 6 AP-2014]